MNGQIYKETTAAIPVEACLDVAAVMILFITTDEEVALVNRKGQEILGCGEEEILGRNWFDSFLPSSGREPGRALFHELLRGHDHMPVYAENTVLTARGEERMIGWHHVVVRDDEGRIAGTLSSGQDITDFRAKEAALRESDARSRAVLETTVDAIITADEKGRIQMLNPAAERMFGYDSDEAVGQNLRILMPSPYREEHDRYMRTYLATGVRKIIGVGRELVGQRKDGSIFPLELAVSEFDVAGRRYFTSVIRDISDRRALEKEVLRISEDERERIGRDLHDGLGSLLAGASMGVQALAQKARTGRPVCVEDLERLAGLLDEGTQHAHALAKGLNPVRLENEGLVAALAELAANVEEISGITCTFMGSPDLPPLTKDISMQMYRIAQEAVANAVKHAEASYISVKLSASREHVELVVRDDGSGLPSEEKRKGLGMHIMPYRARLIGAHFSIETGKAGGTVVSCRAPLTGSTSQ